MFGSVQSAKRKVITFDDDGEAVPRSVDNKKHNNAKSSSNDGVAAQKNDATLSNGTAPDSSETSSPSESTQLIKKQKKKLLYKDEARPKKLANKEPTTDAIIQKAKDLKKHRLSLPIYTGNLQWHDRLTD
ncbi:hypothetical protein BGX26_001731 [Mortierella sp. AD094]|nr:hypothetical protein BGX26_001731 [Mortierella sp. AD094]